MGQPVQIPSYGKVRLWCQEYGRSDVPDQRGVGDFLECETKEAVRSLQAELLAMADGRFDEKILDNLVGVRRRGKHGSYVEWAKLMLKWLAHHKG